MVDSSEDILVYICREKYKNCKMVFVMPSDFIYSKSSSLGRNLCWLIEFVIQIGDQKQEMIDIYEVKQDRIIDGCLVKNIIDLLQAEMSNYCCCVIAKGSCMK